MSTAILPDDSVVVRMPTHTVHVDASSRAIHVREPSTTSQLGGIIRASFPLSSADRIRLMTARTGKQHLCLDLSSGETLDLGEVPSADVAMVTARAIADLTRCKIEVAGSAAGVAGPSARFTEGETYAAPGFVPWSGEELPAPDESSLAISPKHADRMYRVIEALVDSQDELSAPPIPEDPPLVPGDTRTVEMTREEAERAMARARARAKPADDGAEPVMPSDLEEDESDQPTVTPPAPVRTTSPMEETDGLSSTDRDRPIEEMGVDGLAQTIADRRISDLDLSPTSEMTSAAEPAEPADGESDPSLDVSGDSTQPDRPMPEALRTDQDAGPTTQPDAPVDAFDENTELDEEALEVARQPVFQQLLLESQMAAAMSPSPDVGESGDGSESSPGQTDLHVVAPPSQTRLEAVVEMLRLTVEALPEASLSLAEEED